MRLSIKDRIILFSDDHRRLFAALVASCTFLLTLIVLLHAWASLTTLYGAPAIRFNNSGLNIFHSATGTWLQVNTEIESEDDTWVHISRELVLRSSSERILLPSSEYYYPSGTHKLSAVYTLPIQVSKGEWCLEYAIRYKKDWSITERSLATTIGCTFVEPMVNSGVGK